jgi:cytochrome c553
MAGPEEIVARVCAPCHGDNGVGVAPAFPNLGGQQTAYLVKQLANFAKGKRRNDTMAAALAQINADEFLDLAAYYHAQPPSPGTTGDTALAAVGRKLFQDGDDAAGVPACASCHQDNATGSGRYPRLAGQHPAYTLQQLQNFKAGARGNDPRRMMRLVAGRLTESQMKALAEYLAGL